MRLAMLFVVLVGCASPPSSAADPWPGMYLGTITATDTPCGGTAQPPQIRPNQMLTIERDATGLFVAGPCPNELVEQSPTQATPQTQTCNGTITLTITGGDATLEGAMLTYHVTFHATEAHPGAPSSCDDVDETFVGSRL